MRRRALLKGMASAAGVTLAGSSFASMDAWAQQPKPGRWLRMESANFIAVSAVDEERTRKEVAALEAFRAFLVRMMPLRMPSPVKLTVDMTGSDKDFNDTAPWAKGHVLGFYQTSAELVRAVSSVSKSFESQRNMPKNVRALDARAVLLHEYTHHHFAANTGIYYPSWYNEGLAEFLSTADLADDGLYIGKFTAARASWLLGADWLDIQTFLTRNPQTLSRDRESQFYAQAWLTVHYLTYMPERSAGLEKYLAALQAGGDPMQAFEPAFGVSTATFDRELRSYRSKPMRFSKADGIALDAALPVTVERFPVSADGVMMPLGHIRSVPGRKQAAKSVAAIRAAAKKHEGDAFAIRARALAEIWYGDLGDARKLLDGLLAGDAANAETQHLNGLCDLRMAYAAADPKLFARARAGFTAAHRIDETRASSLFRYAECGFRESGAIDAHYLDVLVAAFKLSPQVEEYAMAAAIGLMQNKRFPEAVNVLRRVVADSHDADTTEAADLMAAAKAETAPATFTFPAAADIVEDDDDY